MENIPESNIRKTKGANRWGWLKGYYIATWIIAFITTSGFVYSFFTAQDVARTSKETAQLAKETAKALEKLSESLGSYTQPILQFDGYIFSFSGPNKSTVMCENLPSGIVVSYKNKSKVPLMIYKADVKYYYGERQAHDDPINIRAAKGTQILVPEESLASWAEFNKSIIEQLKIPGRLFYWAIYRN